MYSLYIMKKFSESKHDFATKKGFGRYLDRLIWGEGRERMIIQIFNIRKLSNTLSMYLETLLPCNMVIFV